MTHKRCPQCGQSVSPDAAFCGECGQPLPVGRLCPNCGFAGNAAAATYCVQCGAPLRERRSLSPFLWPGGLVALALVLVAGVILWQTGLIEKWIAGSSMPVSSRPATATTASRMEEAVTATMAELAAQPPTDTPPPSSTLTPPSTATPQPTATQPPTATPLPTATPRPSATPSRTPTPAPTPCGVAVFRPFSQIWQAHSDQLGCPSSAGKSGTWMAEEDFQRGRMFWREDNRKIYVLYSNGRWERYDDTWREGDPTFTCGMEQHPPTPVRGFGKVWCTYDRVRQGLGNATGIEGGDHGAVQDFGNGLILRTGGGRVYIFYSDGTWTQ